MDPTAIPLSVYVHLPWCVRKCPYCDFNSHTRRDALPQQDYVAALLEDLTSDWSQLDNPRAITSVFFGGGTPSLFKAAALAPILESLKALNGEQSMEITLEANPGAVEYDNFASYQDAGINRISLGVQSFNDTHLRTLGRIHDQQAALTAFQDIREAGFVNVNLDLMFGLPNQTVDQALDDLQQAIALEPTHLSWYQLTLEPGTPFYEKPPVLPHEDKLWEIQERGIEKLQAAGYEQYEISAFSRPGYQCLHNLNYWQFGDYLGIGAGAHGKLTQQNGEVVRTEKIRHPNRYMTADHKMAEQHQPKDEDLAFEFMLNQLRLNDGVSRTQIQQRTRQGLTILNKKLAQNVKKGLLLENPTGWQPTTLGRRFLNDLQASFLPQ